MKTFPRILLMIVATFAILVFGLCALIFTSLGGMQAFYTPFLLVLVPGLLILAVLWIFSLAGNKVRKLVTLVFLGIMFISVAGYHAINAWFANIPTVSDQSVNLEEYRPFVTGVSLNKSKFLPVSAEDKPVVSFELAGAGNWAEAVVFSQDMKWLATKWPSGKVQVWDVGKGASIAEWPTDRKEKDDPLVFLNRHRQPQIAFIPNSQQLLVAGTTVAIHELLTGKVIRTLEPSPKETGPTLFTLDPAPKEIGPIALSASGGRVVGSLRQQLIFWSLADGKQLSALPTKRAPWEGPYARSRQQDGNMRPPASMRAGRTRAFSRDGRLFAVGLEYTRIDLWNLDDGKWLDTMPDSGQYGMSSGKYVTSLAFLDGQKLAAVFMGEELTIFVLNTNTRTTLLRHQRTNLLRHEQRNPPDCLEIRSIAASADGQRLAIAGMRMGWRRGFFAPAGDGIFDVPMYGEVQVWDAAGAKLLVIFKGKASEKFANVALDESGQRVAAVTTGVKYDKSLLTVAQQEMELRLNGPLRVSVWDVPSPAR